MNHVKIDDTVSNPIRSTLGEIFTDGSLIEVIKAPSANAQLQLLISDGEENLAADRILHGGVTYAPAQLNRATIQAIRMPAQAEPYGSTSELFAYVSELVLRVTRLPQGVVTLITHFIFATWVADRLPMAPLMLVVAPAGVNREPLLQLLGLLCRRTLQIADFRLATLWSIPMELRPTLLIEAPTITRTLSKLLQSSTRPGAFVALGNQIADLACAKVIFARELGADLGMIASPLEIALTPSISYVPILDRAEAEEVATRFQAQLLMYRLRNHGKVAAASLNLDEFTAPTQQLAQTLAQAIVGDDALQRQLLPFLRKHDGEIRQDRVHLFEAIVLEALLAACHDTKLQKMPIGDLTVSANTILAGRGDPRRISPEVVGWKLRALQLHTEFIAGGRKALALSLETRNTIHSLAAAYGVRTVVAADRSIQ